MDAKQEALDILQKICTKLQALPDASSIEIGGFFILLLFVCKCYEFKTYIFPTYQVDLQYRSKVWAHHPYSEPLTFIFIYTAEQLRVKGLAQELS